MTAPAGTHELPVQLRALVEWSGSLAGNATTAAGELACAPLCCIQPVAHQGFGLVLTCDVAGDTILLKAEPQQQLCVDNSDLTQLPEGSHSIALHCVAGCTRGITQ
jgi:hypothetical protein